jgi:hypothetical protein
MSALAEDLFDEVERARAAFPGRELILALLTEIAEEQSRGRSLDRYLEGWSGRLLEDEPEHRGGLLVRLQAMAQGVISPQASEIASLSARLGRLVRPEDAATVWEAISALHELAPGEADVYLGQAAVRRCLGDAAGEVAIIKGLLDARHTEVVSLSEPQLSGIWRRVRELCAPTGPEPDSDLFKEATIALARTAGDWRVSQELYIDIFEPTLSKVDGWGAVLEEIEVLGAASGRLPQPPVLGLFASWLGAGDKAQGAERTSLVAGWLEDNGELLMESDGPADTAGFATLLDPTEVVRHAWVAGWAASSLLAAEDVTSVSAAVGVRVVVLALANGIDVSDQGVRALADWVGESDAVAKAFKAALWDELEDDGGRHPVLRTILADPRFRTWTGLERWLEMFEAAGSASIPPEVALGFVRAARSLCEQHPKGTAACLAEQAAKTTLQRLQGLVISSLRDWDDAEVAHGELVSLLAAFPPSLAEYVEMCLLDANVRRGLTEDGFVRLVACDDRHPVLALLRSARRWPDAVLPDIMSRALVLVDALLGLLKKSGASLLERAEPADIRRLWSSCAPAESVEGADLFVAAISELRKGWNPAWLTPVEHEMEALVMARRYPEAESLSARYPGLTLGSDHQVADERIKQARAWGRPRSAPLEVATYSRVASYVLQDWQARMSRGTGSAGGSGAGPNGRLRRVGKGIARWVSGSA